MRARQKATASRREALWTSRVQAASTPGGKAAVAFDRTRTALIQSGQEHLLEELARVINTFREAHAQ